MKQQLHITALFASIIVACLAVVGGHRSMASDGEFQDSCETIASVTAGSIDRIPMSAVLSMGCMPQIAGPNVVVVRTFRGCVSHVHSLVARRMSGLGGKYSPCGKTSSSIRLYDVSAPFTCNDLKDYYIYMLRRIVI